MSDVEVCAVIIFYLQPPCKKPKAAAQAEKTAKVVDLVDKPKKVRQQEAKKVKETVEDIYTSSESEMSDVEVCAVSTKILYVVTLSFIYSHLVKNLRQQHKWKNQLK